MKTLLLVVLALAGCSSVPSRNVVAKFKTEDCTIAGIHYPAYYCVYVRVPGKSGDEATKRIEVSAKDWDAITIAR